MATTEVQEQALRNDIRLLGRLLGQAIRAHEGAQVFDTIESIRRTAVRFRRNGDEKDGAVLEQLLHGLSQQHVNAVVRAFSYFLHLSNIADDRDQHRQRRERRLAGESAERGSLQHTVAHLREQGHDGKALRKLLNSTTLVPVLTAYPAEVQRNSTLDIHHALARLLPLRDTQQTPDEADTLELTLLGRITTLWQTRLLRDARLTVADEIDNALSYYRSTFLRTIPAT